MHSPPPTDRGPGASSRRWILSAGLTGAAVLSLVVASQLDVAGAFAQREVRLGRAFAWLVIGNLLWLPLIPLVARGAALVPLQRRASAVFFHLAASIGVAVLHGSVAVGLAWILDPFPGLVVTGFGQGLVYFLAFALHLELVVYWGVLGAVLAYRGHIEGRARERRNAELEVSLSRARLQALQSRIQPHFFFNSLNTVSMMVRGGEADEAVRTLAQIGDLMRDALREPGAHSTVAEEVGFAERYLAVEAARFSERVRFATSVSPSVADIPTPPLFLQPLVENAVRHGVEARESGGVIRVVADHIQESSHEWLSIQVLDNGTGMPERNERSLGVGLENTTERTLAFYGAGSLTLDREDPWTVAEIRIPWTVASKVKA